MKTEQGEIPALFSCWEAWGWTMPRWRADSGAGGGLAALWGARLLQAAGDPKGPGGERKAPSAPAGAYPLPH